MLYENLAETYEKIETSSGSLDKIAILAELLEKAGDAEIGKIVALTTGKLYPDWKGEPEIGIAEKMAIQVVATAAGVSEGEVKKQLQALGDVGVT
ncbi:MAG: DNA ligase, partial [Candidatus Thorarchaeota archaeon]